MEVHDFDEEYLHSVLKDDHENRSDDDVDNFKCNKRVVSIKATELQEESFSEPFAVTDQSNPDRYRLLPDYARNSFTKKKEFAPQSSTKHTKAIEGKQEEHFCLSEDEMKFLPPGIATPNTIRINEMIKLTAARSAISSQFEVLLKVKQVDNSDFSFLQPEDSLNPYYLLLKRRHGKIVQPPSKDEASVPENPIGGLLDMYSSSSDEDDNGSEMSAKLSSTNKARNDTVNGGKSEETGSAAGMDTADNEVIPAEERKAKRLKRAKLMKSHFATQLNQM